MSEKIVWGVYDPIAEVNESSRNLPHRDQAGALTFVTFRLADSMSKEVVARWHEELDQWLSKIGLEGRSVDEVLASTTVAAELKNQLRKFKNKQWHQHLDHCHGDCVLHKPDVATVITNSLQHFNGERYDLERFVVPNHVHVLIQMHRDFELRKQFREIQRYSARQINPLLGRNGELWQGEPFDHVVRSEKQFLYLRNYIAENPKKGKVPEGEFVLWICEQSK